MCDWMNAYVRAESVAVAVDCRAVRLVLVEAREGENWCETLKVRMQARWSGGGRVWSPCSASWCTGDWR